MFNFNIFNFMICQHISVLLLLPHEERRPNTCTHTYEACDRKQRKRKRAEDKKGQEGKKCRDNVKGGRGALLL